MYLYLAINQKSIQSYFYRNILVLVDATLFFLSINSLYLRILAEINQALFFSFLGLFFVISILFIFDSVFPAKERKMLLFFQNEDVTLIDEKMNIVFGKILSVELKYQLRKGSLTGEKNWGGYCILSGHKSTSRARITRIDDKILITLKSNKVPVKFNVSLFNMPPNLFIAEFLDKTGMLFQ